MFNPFKKLKQDIFCLRSENDALRHDVARLKERLNEAVVKISLIESTSDQRFYYDPGKQEEPASWIVISKEEYAKRTKEEWDKNKYNAGYPYGNLYGYMYGYGQQGVATDPCNPWGNSYANSQSPRKPEWGI